MLKYRPRTFSKLSYNPLLIVPDIIRVRDPNRSDILIYIQQDATLHSLFDL